MLWVLALCSSQVVNLLSTVPPVEVLFLTCVPASLRPPPWALAVGKTVVAPSLATAVATLFTGAPSPNARHNQGVP